MSQQGNKQNPETEGYQMLLPFTEDLAQSNALPLGERLDAPEDEEKEPNRNARMRKLLYSGLVYFEHQLGEQKSGMALEIASDVPPAYGVAAAAQSGDIISTACAVVVVTLMERQRRALKNDLKQILEIWTEFQHNRSSQDREARRTAYDILEQRIRESGIIFEKLPEHDPQDFHAGKFRDLARQYTIHSPHTEDEQAATANKGTLRDKWVAAGKFIGEATEQFFNAPVNLRRIPFMEAARGSISHFCKYALLKPEARQKHKIIKSRSHELDLSRVKVNSMEVLNNKDYDPKLLHELVSTRESVREHIRQDKEASVLFIMQSLFMAGQTISLIDNAIKGDSGSAFMNAACLNMASVALRVLAENKVHLTQALDGERSKMSAQYASVAGLLDKKDKRNKASDPPPKSPAEEPDIANDVGPSPE